MPEAPSDLRILPEAQDDIEKIAEKDSEAAERILKKIKEWQEMIKWDRVPQDHLTYLKGSGSYNFYRQRVGNSGHRVVYEISDDEMVAVAVFEKDDNAYNLGSYEKRAERDSE